MAEMDQITQRLSCLDQWTVLQIHYDESQPKYTWWHGLGLGLTGVLPKCHKGHCKVTERSNQPKIAENSLFCWVCFNSAQFNHKTNGTTNGFPIPENLGVEPLSVNIWLQGTEVWHISTLWWLSWPMTLTHGVTLALKHKNNGTNDFSVPENVGV